MNSLLYCFANLRALTSCLIAHMMTSSGAISAINVIPTRREATVSHFSSGSGMLGWTATQVHAKIVTRQLQMMLQIVLPNTNFSQVSHSVNI